MSEWQPGGESGKSYEHRRVAGFYDRWLSGDVILDIGCGGSRVLPRAIGIDLGYAGYDGIHLPFADRHLADNDCGFDYAIDPGSHSAGCYEIELVVGKIAEPSWRLA